MDTGTCTWVFYKIFSGMYPNRTYGFSLPEVLWKVVAKMPIFVISPVTINILIGFKAVTQVLQV